MSSLTIVDNEKYDDIMRDNIGFKSLLREILAAYTSGNLHITSHDLGDSESIARPFHEEWFQAVKEALGEL